MDTQVDRTVQLFTDGETLTTKKLARLICCGSPPNVLSRAIKRMDQMGLQVKRFRKRVRGNKKPMHYRMEITGC